MTVPDWGDDPEWQAYARHVIDELVPMIEQSAVTCSLVPSGEPDVKFAIELGLSIMLDKPVVLLVPSGTPVPAHLARVADEIVEFSGRLDHSVAQRLGEAVKRIAP